MLQPPKKITERPRRIALLVRRILTTEKLARVVDDPKAIAEQARKVRSMARLFDAACDYSLAADTFDAACKLYQAAGQLNEAEDCRKHSDENAVAAMDRILRIACEGEAERAKAGATVEVVVEVAS